jgi:sugar (pentulose or hexulose) kinase
MTAARCVAVIDIGKTNGKVALVEMDSFSELAMRTRPNVVIRGEPYPHYDVDAIWSFILEALTALNREHDIDAITVTTHGASCALLNELGELAMPVLDYEHDGPDALAGEYDVVRPTFAETGSPRLPGGLNLGAQIFWLQHRHPEPFAGVATILTYPQYWTFRLSGIAATEITSLGTHTDLWCPARADYSTLVDRMGWKERFAPRRWASDCLGAIRPEIATKTGLRPDVRIHCGIHDSNASLLPHLLSRKAPFAVVSTGTWVVAMATGDKGGTLDPERDTLINVDAFGRPVRSARFMGGRERAILNEGRQIASTDVNIAAVLSRQLMLLPSVLAGSGPFPGFKAGWRGQVPSSSGALDVTISFYLALMSSVCLDLIDAEGPIIVEGPFAHDRNYLHMLAAATKSVVIVNISGGTGPHLGAALLAAPMPAPPLPTADTVIVNDAREWRAYADSWNSAVCKLLKKERQ